ncbi:MAG: peptidylprolyl isomerase [Lachnospiraceae bacterium]|nr:peptidylprolyl isomerase [Lachnospiraceae bacterium]
MFRNNKKPFNKIAIALLFTLALLTTACAKKDIVITTGFDKDELMRINNKTCYLPEMMLYLSTIQNQYEDVYGPELWSQSHDGESLEKRVKDMVLAKIAQVKVMNLMAESYGLTLNDKEKETVKKASESFFGSLSDREKEVLNVKEDDIVSFYSEYALANKVYEYVIRDINPEISDDEARTITVQAILIKTYTHDARGNRLDYSERTQKEAAERARLAHDLAVAGEDSFEAVSAKYNEGDETTYTFKRGEMDESFEDVAFSLDKDQISDVFKTDEGYYILKCVSDFDIDETQLNKVEILAARKEAVFDETYDQFLEGLTKILNEKLYDSIIMIHDPEVTTKTFFDVDF